MRPDPAKMLSVFGAFGDPIFREARRERGLRGHPLSVEEFMRYFDEPFSRDSVQP